jgi:hypothetical protein
MGQAAMTRDVGMISEQVRGSAETRGVGASGTVHASKEQFVLVLAGATIDPFHHCPFSPEFTATSFIAPVHPVFTAGSIIAPPLPLVHFHCWNSTARF